MVDPQIEKALNQQISHEMASAYAYLAMAVHFEHQNLGGMAHWMHLQRDEEQAHATRLIKYLLDRGGAVDLGALQKPRSDYGSIREVFETALEMEQANTRAINEVYALAVQLKDYATQSNIQWFVDEQVEEEKLMDEVLALVKMADDAPSSLLVLNKQLSERQTAANG